MLPNGIFLGLAITFQLVVATAENVNGNSLVLSPASLEEINASSKVIIYFVLRYLFYRCLKSLQPDS